MTVIDEIAAERRRQIDVEGFDAAHDDSPGNRGIALAAATYAYAAALPDSRRQSISGIYSIDNNQIARDLWPWHRSWWKPTDRRRDLVKAGALIVAEIERLDRAQGRPAAHWQLRDQALILVDDLGEIRGRVELFHNDNPIAPAGRGLRWYMASVVTGDGELLYPSLLASLVSADTSIPCTWIEDHLGIVAHRHDFSPPRTAEATDGR